MRKRAKKILEERENDPNYKAEKDDEKHSKKSTSSWRKKHAKKIHH